MIMPPESPSFWSLFAADAPSATEPAPPSFWSLFANDELPNDGSGGSQAAPPASCLAFDPNQMYWAMRNLPVTEALKPLAIIGVTGSGKTTHIQLFLQIGRASCR